MKTNKKILNDIISSRCCGLSGGSALKKSNNERVLAVNVYKENGPFYCSVCLSEAIVRKCSNKIHHFAHKARLSPFITAKDRELHEKCKNEICKYLNLNFPNGNWKVERPIPANPQNNWNKEIIPDISGRYGGKNDIPVAIEIQKTPYTIDKIFNKTVEYKKRGIYVVWIVPLSKDLGNEPFRPRLYEKYLHSIYYGRTYYWTPNSSPKILSVHYSPTKRWIEENSWFDVENREERNEGGFYLTYKTIKNPNYGKDCFLDLDFRKENRKAFCPKNQKKSIPESKILQDKQDKWWPTDEYKNLTKQFTVINANSFLNDYDSFDDYDDELYLE